MRLLEVKVRSDNGDWHHTYYVEPDGLVSNDEVMEYVANLATADFEGEDDLIADDPREMSEDEAYALLVDDHLRTRMLITSLNRPDNVVLGIYSIDKSFSIGDTECFLFTVGISSQEAEVSAIGKTDEKHTREQVIHEGWVDCVTQLKRYWKTPGVTIATGVLVVFALSQDEYSSEMAERKVVLV